MTRFCAYLLFAALPICVAASADCNIDPARVGKNLSPSALAVRNTLFVKLCSITGGSVVDITDPTLRGRLLPPNDLQAPPKKDMGRYYTEDDRRSGRQGRVLLAMLVETDGSTHEVTVLSSSRYSPFDAGASKLWKDSRFNTPAKLDGQPVPALIYVTQDFSLR